MKINDTQAAQYERLVEFAESLVSDRCYCDFPPAGEEGVIMCNECKAREALGIEPNAAHATSFAATDPEAEEAKT